VDPEAYRLAVFHALLIARALIGLPIDELLEKAREANDDITLVALQVLAEAKEKLEAHADLIYGEVTRQ
jgi:hypothetical protein